MFWLKEARKSRKPRTLRGCEYTVPAHGKRGVHVLRGSVLVYAYLLGIAVGVHEVSEKGLLELHCAGELLVEGSGFRFKHDHVKLELPATNNALDELRETGCGAAGEEYTERAFLLHREFD